MESFKHLWEIKYNCDIETPENNSDYKNLHFKSFADFMKEHGKVPIHKHVWKIVSLWAWEEGGESKYGNEFTGDVSYRNGLLRIFSILPTKGIFRCESIDVCRADEPEVFKFLQESCYGQKRYWSAIDEYEHFMKIKEYFESNKPDVHAGENDDEFKPWSNFINILRDYFKGVFKR